MTEVQHGTVVPSTNPREQRRHNAGDEDQRIPFARDRDRIHYSSAFRRLSGVSQVVSADHVEPFHNRLIHTTKVAQLGRRLAEYLLEQQPREAEIGGLHPEVVEAACLAHDLGHPPFGHVGEDTLDELVRKSGDEDGYEGNAQTFRIITKLSLRSEKSPGLDLTRGVLGATIKYPWSRAKAISRKSKKFGYYRTEKEDFTFARECHANHDIPTLEAALMDYADDIAYSVHDVEDFHRIGAVPWHLLQLGRVLPAESRPTTTPSLQQLIDAALKQWFLPP